MRITSFLGRKVLLQHPLASFSKIALWLGLFLFLLGLLLFVIIGAITGDNEIARVMIFAISSQGLVWGIIGLIFIRIVSANTRKLKELKQSGRQYEAEIINLQPIMGINANLYGLTVYAECIYLNEKQQRCKVKSTMFMWESYKHEGLQAHVYVDWNDPRRYAVEIAKLETGQTQVDIDYT